MQDHKFRISNAHKNTDSDDEMLKNVRPKSRLCIRIQKNKKCSTTTNAQMH